MKRNIILGSLLAVFLMLMIPNIGAVEYQTVKETYDEKYDSFQSIIGFITNKNDLFPLIPNFIVILYEVLQGFFNIGMFLLSIMVLDSSENGFITFIVYYGLAFLTGFISSKCDIFMTDHFDLTTIQELIIDYGGYLMLTMFILINNFTNGDNNFIKRTCESKQF